MSRIRIISNPENKPLDVLVKEELSKPRVTWKDLKIKRRKEIDKHMVLYLDYLLLRIVDAYFVDVRDEINAFIQHIEYFERHNYYVNGWLKKYNVVMERRRQVKGLYL